MRKSFRQIEKYRKAKLCAEQTNIIFSDAPLKICLIFPNTYHVGMSNLAVHSLYSIINARPGACCERSFFEEPLTGYSLETGTPLGEFDILAFSVSFELDYPKILKILAAADLPLRAASRNERHPLIIAGGPCAFSNPEPMADFIDLFAIGEGEELIGDILDRYSESRRCRSDRVSLLREFSKIPGAYAPSLYEPVYESGGALSGMARKEDGNLPVMGRIVLDLDRCPCCSVILTPATEFADMFLLELGRGCRRGCKFCSACHTYYRRNRSLGALIEQVEQAGDMSARVGLVTSDLSDYPQAQELLEYLMKKKKLFSVSSIRADALTDDILAAMRESAQKTLTLAPEVASEKLMSLTGKRISLEILLGVIERALARGIINFRLYFMIGFPDEDDEDAHAIVRQASAVHQLMLAAAKRTRRVGKLTISVNPFIPKPFTPLEAEPFAGQAVLVRRIRILRNGIARMGNTALLAESPRMAELQCALSRGDRRAAILVASAAGGKPLGEIMREHRQEVRQYVGRLPEDGMRPWSVISPPSAQKRKTSKEGLN